VAGVWEEVNMGSECDKLDAFLLSDLGGDDAARFERHLETCTACREAIDQERWLDELLRSPARVELEPAPDALRHSIRTSVSRHRRQRRLVAGVLAVAVALAVAAGWTLWAGRPSPSPSLTGRGNTELAAQSEPSQSSGEYITKAVVIGDENTIMVPVESRYPNVTVVRVYSEYRPKHVAQAPPGQPADGDGFDLPQSINGG
jgi:anti-sigma factor RsiW